MKVVVGTAPVDLTVGGRGRPVIQNLGPGMIYLDSSSEDVSTESGIQIPVGVAYEFPTAAADDEKVSIVSDAADTDVRVVVMGGA